MSTTTATPIEDRAMWMIHRVAADHARQCGACWACAQQVGFAATDKLEGVATARPLCAKCERIAERATP